jgi:hypothetical protein
MLCKDGRWVNTGVPPRSPASSASSSAGCANWAWPTSSRTRSSSRSARRWKPITYDLIGVDAEATAIFIAGREALALIAANVSAYDFFIGFQRRGIAVGVIYSPEEAFEDEHFRARGFQVEVTARGPGRTFRYPGAPYPGVVARKASVQSPGGVWSRARGQGSAQRSGPIGSSSSMRPWPRKPEKPP